MRTVIILILGLTLMGCLWWAEHASLRYDPADPSFNKEYWSERISHVGPARASAEFVKKNTTMSVGRKHFAAHVFGKLLYEHAGTAGIAACDPSFGFGCYHGLFAAAISAGGLALVPELDRACIAAYGPLGTGCQHGIGHGLLELFGPARLADALAACHKTTEVAPLLGCASGVFMEYAVPVSIFGTTTAIEPRPFDAVHPYDPCPTVSQEFKPSCYYEFGNWWQSLGFDPARIVSLCREISNAANRRDCFLGVGDAVVEPRYDSSVAVATCTMALGDDQVACRAGALWAFLSNPAHRAEGPSLCSGLSPDNEKACTLMADLTEGRRSP